MSVNPYDPCPCGSGKKFKWCCQKLAKYGEKAEQLLDSDQPNAALQAIDEGLAQDPSNLWLRSMKAEILLSMHDHQAADQLINQILTDSPGHISALLLRIKHQLEHGEGSRAAASLQELMEANQATDAGAIAQWMSSVGHALAVAGYPFAALGHLRWSRAHTEQDLEDTGRIVATFESALDIAPWLKDNWQLRPAPPDDDAVQGRWRQAIERSARAHWGEAGKLFESITAEQPGRADAWLNLGLCQAWLARDAEAARSLTRYAELESDPERALQAETLAHCLDPRPSEQTVEQVRWRWHMRDRTRVLQALRDHPQVQEGRTDAQDRSGGDRFFVLDKPLPAPGVPITADNQPAVTGFVQLGGDVLELVLTDPAPDDARARLVTEAAGAWLDPDPLREVIGHVPLSIERLQRAWAMSSRTRPHEFFEARRQLHDQMYRDNWSDTPQGWLANKTPREATRVPELRRSLRAMLLLAEYEAETQFSINLDTLRDALGLEREPTFEGPELDIASLPLSRLRQVRAETLGPGQRHTLLERARRFALPTAAQQAARAIVEHRGDHDAADVGAAFQSLIHFAASRFDRTAAVDWARRAQQSGIGDPAVWEIAEWEVSLRMDPPSNWVPPLARLMQKYSGDEKATAHLFAILVEAGLVQIVQDPARPDRMLMDTRLLEQLMAHYGAGTPGGVDLTPATPAAGGKIWTPESERPAARDVWSPNEPPAERPKLWTPGG